MKPNAVTCLLLIFCVMNLFFGCSQRKAAPLPELERAEAVMFEHPDSALRILESMPMPANKEQHALWCLLVTQAKYKQYLPIPSDSLIRIAYDYYKPTDDARRKAMAALYMGNVNYELQKIETSMAYYLEAKDEMVHTDDYTLGYLVMSSLGDLYLYRDLTDYALEVIQKSYDYAVKTPYLKYKAYALRDMARVYAVKDRLDSAIVYYNKAIGETQKANLSDLEQAFKNELASIYILLGDSRKALDLKKEVIESPYRTAQIYYGMGVAYINVHEYDSAYYCLNRALGASNIYTRGAVYQSLLSLSKRCPQYRDYALQYSDSLRFYEDSIRSIDKSKEIVVYQEQIKQEKLKLEKANATRWLLVSVLAGVVLLALLVYVYQRRKIVLHRKEEELNRLGLRLHEHESLMDRNNAYIAELEAQIAEGREASDQLGEQEETLASLRKENDSLRRDADRLRKEMEKLRLPSEESGGTERIAAELRQTRQENEELRIRMLERYPELSSLHAHPVYLQAEGMSRLRQICDTVYGGFCRRLSQSVPSLSEYEVELCCLIKLRFTVGEIAALLGISPSSGSTSKHRVKKKIYSCLGITDKKSLDLWVWEA